MMRISERLSNEGRLICVGGAVFSVLAVLLGLLNRYCVFSDGLEP